MNRDRAAPGPVTDAAQPVMSRDRTVAAPGGDAAQTVVSPDSGDILDGGTAGDKRLISNAVAGGREAQIGENPSEPPPTNPVLVPPQQVSYTWAQTSVCLRDCPMAAERGKAIHCHETT